jgi:DNA polymerase-3 subunit delta
LRKACEKAKSAVAIACYADTERDLAKLIDDELRASNLKIAPDARAALTSLLGGDRQASRNEIRKVALYAHGQREVTLDDVVAIVTDASGLALDPIVDSAFAGRAAEVETTFAKAMAAGIYPGMIIMSAQRQAAALHKARLSIEEGRSELEALDSGFPRLHFSRKTLVETALRNTSVERMGRVMAQLADAAFDMRKQSSLADVIAQRALLAIAVNARRRG